MRRVLCVMGSAKSLQDHYQSIVSGSHRNPFSVLGVHREDAQRMVRVFEPVAVSVCLLDADGHERGPLKRVHEGGIFAGPLPPRLRSYQLRMTGADGSTWEGQDPYRFSTTLGELDLYLLGAGEHADLYRKLGAHVTRHQGVSGTVFAVWAPNASRVSVVGDFNHWDGRRHVMRLHPGNGIWEIFIPGVGQGERYKFELIDGAGKLLPLKSDPVGQYQEAPPGNASIVYHSSYRWRDAEWRARPDAVPGLDQPMSIYEVHLGSWGRDKDNRVFDYRALANKLVKYVQEMGFTHVEFLPVTEHPFDGSWGYQPIGLFSPTQRFGSPDDFRFLVDSFHQAGIGVIADWVPAHFPRDEHGLHRFDGSALYEHEDPRRGEHQDWGTLVFNYGRREVVNYLIASALCWLREFHIDGLRVDAVASMLYLDYSRDKDEWLPNEHGGNEHLEAVSFLKRLNTVVRQENAISHAEESTVWPGVSRPVEAGGLGFTCKWNMGWMNDTLSYMSEAPIHRKHHHDKMTFGLIYAFSENFILPLSHDEVVHGKRSLLGRMPGDDWQRYANLRAYYAFMFAHPGKKLLFMGAEIAQEKEWNHDQCLDWHLLEAPANKGVQQLVKTLNHLYRAEPALFQLDFSPDGFEWIDADDRDSSVFSWVRYSANGDWLVCVCNFTPVVRPGFRLGVPAAAAYRVLLDTDATLFNGSGALQSPELKVDSVVANGRPDSIELTLPPLATLWLKPVSKDRG